TATARGRMRASDPTKTEAPGMVGLKQAWPAPSRPRPIVIIGAGDIVRTAHLPAYRRLGLPIAGLFDLRGETARETARMFEVPRVFDGLADAVAPAGAIFDLAVPGSQIVSVLACLPAGAGVLIQKPMGEDLSDARRILAACRSRGLIAAVNFQLRF